jgi:hypothetical protein
MSLFINPPATVPSMSSFINSATVLPMSLFNNLATVLNENRHWQYSSRINK